MRSIKYALLPAALLMVLAACAPNFPTLQPNAGSPGQGMTDPVENPAEVEPAASSAPADAPTDTGMPTIDTSSALPTDTQAPAPTTGEVVEECPFRPDLHATDPATVSLASGEVQLVEFFAFW